MIAVAFTVSSDRPGYLERSLESWSKARGVKGVHFVFCCEPGEYQRETAEIITSAAAWATQATVIYNPSRLGVVANTRQALERGLVARDYTIVTEEDITVADDILEYHAWAQRFAGDETAAGVCSFSLSTTDGPERAFRAPFFCALGWGTWRDRMPLLDANWGGVVSNQQAWDRGILERVVAGQGYHFIFPACSRTQHIGKYGLHGQGDPARFEGTVSRSFRPHYEPQEFQLGELTDPIVRL